MHTLPNPYPSNALKMLAHSIGPGGKTCWHCDTLELGLSIRHVDKLEAVTASDVYGAGSVAPFMSVFVLSLFHLYKILWNNAVRVMSANQR